MILQGDKEELEKMVMEIIKREKNKDLTQIKVKKTGDTPLENFDLVNRAYLQQHGTKAQRPTAGLVGRMFFNTSSAVANWDTGTIWVDGNGNVV